MPPSFSVTAWATTHMHALLCMGLYMPPQMRVAVKAKKSALLALLRCGMPDFSLQLKWELASGMPGVSGLLRRYAPHDTYSLWKKVRRGRGAAAR